MPSRKISPQMLLANLEKLRKEVGQNPAYQAYLNSVADLEAKLRILHEPDRFGRIRLMSAEDKTELMRLSLAVGQQAADAEKKIPQMPKGTAELMEKISSLAHGLHETAAAYDPKKPQSISMLMEDMRTLTLDVRNTPMKGSLSGAVSQRQPLSFLDRKGREISGVFTAKREMKVWDALNRDLEELSRELKGEQNKQLLRSFLNRWWSSLPEGPDKKENSKASSLFGLLKEMSEKGSEAVLREKMNQVFAEERGGRDITKKIPRKIINKLRVKLWEKRSDIEANLWGAEIPDNARIDSRNSAMSAMADLLGVSHVLARSRPMKLIGKDGSVTEGTFMAAADGLDLRNLSPEAEGVNAQAFIGSTEKEKELIGKGMKSIADLQVLDYICGNTDRHIGNMLYQIDPETKKFIGVQGIDNDCAWGLFSETEEEGGDGKKYMPGPFFMRTISAETYEKVMSLTPETLKFAMRGYGLSNAELDAACKRLNCLKGFLEKSVAFYQNNAAALDEGGGLGTTDGFIRVVQKDEWKKLKIESLNEQKAAPWAKSKLTDANYFTRARDAVVNMPKYLQQQTKAYQSLKSEVAVGVDNRALTATQERETQRAADLLETVKTRTSGNRTSAEYEAMQTALEKYAEYQKGLINRIHFAKEHLNDFKASIRETHGVDVQTEDGEVIRLQPSAEDVLHSVVTPDDLMTQQLLCRKVMETAEAYLQHKGGGLHLPYANRRIEIAKQVRELGRQGVNMKSADLEDARINERETMEEFTRRYGGRKEYEAQWKQDRPAAQPL